VLCHRACAETDATAAPRVPTDRRPFPCASASRILRALAPRPPLLDSSASPWLRHLPVRTCRRRRRRVVRAAPVVPPRRAAAPLGWPPVLARRPVAVAARAGLAFLIFAPYHRLLYRAFLRCTLRLLLDALPPTFTGEEFQAPSCLVGRDETLLFNTPSACLCTLDYTHTSCSRAGGRRLVTSTALSGRGPLTHQSQAWPWRTASRNTWTRPGRPIPGMAGVRTDAHTAALILLPGPRPEPCVPLLRQKMPHSSPRVHVVPFWLLTRWRVSC